MFATMLWLRGHLRSNWRSMLLVVLIAALCGGTVMATTAGARRTTSAFDRFVDDSREPQMFAAVPDRQAADTAAAVFRSFARPEHVGKIAILAAVPTGAHAIPQFDVEVIGVVSETTAADFAIPKVVAGRFATGADEVDVNEAAARLLDLEVGERIAMSGYSPSAFRSCMDGGACAADVELGDVTVAGVTRGVDDLSPENNGRLTIELSPALTERWLPRVAAQLWIAAAWVDDHVDRAAASDAMRTALGADRFDGDEADIFFDSDADGDPQRTADALEIERNALLVVALLAAIGGLIAVPQALRRLQSSVRVEDAHLATLGATRRDLRFNSLVSSLGIGSAAAVTAAGVAFAASPLLPIGLARRAEPSVGLDADWVVLAVGAAATLAVVVVAGLAAAVWPSERRVDAGDNRSNHVLALSRPVPGMARRLLTERGRFSSIAWAAVGSAAIGIAFVAGTAVVIASQSSLVERPALFGAPWDLQGEVVDSGRLGDLATDSRIEAAAILHGGRLTVESRDIGAVGLEPLRGSLEPTMLSGRTVRGDGEVVLSPTTMEALGVNIGDSVRVENAERSGSLIVVGSAVPIAVGWYSDDNGATVTESDFARFASTSLITGEGGLEIAVRASTGTDLDALDADLDTVTGGSDRMIATSFRPARIANLEGVDRALWLALGFAGLLTFLVLAHAITSLAHRGRHDLAVGRSIGFRRRQARQVVMWSGLMLSGAAAAVGTTLGLIAGRVVWRAISSAIHAGNSPQLPAPMVVLTVVLTMAVAAVVAAINARRAVPVSLMNRLRTE